MSADTLTLPRADLLVWTFLDILNVSEVEGWALFDEDTPKLHIGRLDESLAFTFDEDACAHVVRRAFDGSPQHLKALAILRHAASEGWDNLLGSLHTEQGIRLLGLLDTTYDWTPAAHADAAYDEAHTEPRKGQDHDGILNRDLPKCERCGKVVLPHMTGAFAPFCSQTCQRLGGDQRVADRLAGLRYIPADAGSFVMLEDDSGCSLGGQVVCRFDASSPLFARDQARDPVTLRAMAALLTRLADEDESALDARPVVEPVGDRIDFAEAIINDEVGDEATLQDATSHPEAPMT